MPKKSSELERIGCVFQKKDGTVVLENANTSLSVILPKKEGSALKKKFSIKKPIKKKKTPSKRKTTTTKSKPKKQTKSKKKTGSYSAREKIIRKHYKAERDFFAPIEIYSREHEDDYDGELVDDSLAEALEEDFRRLDEKEKDVYRKRAAKKGWLGGDEAVSEPPFTKQEFYFLSQLKGPDGGPYTLAEAYKDWPKLPDYIKHRDTERAKSGKKTSGPSKKKKQKAAAPRAKKSPTKKRARAEFDDYKDPEPKKKKGKTKKRTTKPKKKKTTKKTEEGPDDLLTKVAKFTEYIEKAKRDYPDNDVIEVAWGQMDAVSEDYNKGYADIYDLYHEVNDDYVRVKKEVTELKKMKRKAKARRPLVEQPVAPEEVLEFNDDMPPLEDVPIIEANPSLLSFSPEQQAIKQALAEILDTRKDDSKVKKLDRQWDALDEKFKKGGITEEEYIAKMTDLTNEAMALPERVKKQKATVSEILPQIAASVDPETAVVYEKVMEEAINSPIPEEPAEQAQQVQTLNEIKAISQEEANKVADIAKPDLSKFKKIVNDGTAGYKPVYIGSGATLYLLSSTMEPLLDKSGPAITSMTMEKLLTVSNYTDDSLVCLSNEKDLTEVLSGPDAGDRAVSRWTLKFNEQFGPFFNSTTERVKFVPDPNYPKMLIPASEMDVENLHDVPAKNRGNFALEILREFVFEQTGQMLPEYVGRKELLSDASPDGISNSVICKLGLKGLYEVDGPVKYYWCCAKDLKNASIHIARSEFV